MAIGLGYDRGLRLIQGGDPPAEVPADPSAEQMARDGALVDAVNRGDASAAAAFHDRIRPIVDRTLRRLVERRDPDYDDLAQQGLIELVTSLHRFRAECPLDAWASVVVARVAYKHIRRRRLERKLFVLAPPEAFDVADRSAFGGVGLRSAVRRIEAHCRSLDIKKIWAFLLHDVHGYDLSEVAAITGTSKMAAQSRLVRGRKELHKQIEQDPELATLLNEFALSKVAS